MEEEIQEFVEAFTSFISREIDQCYDLTYNRDVIKIVDARNHLFQNVGQGNAD